MSNIANQGSEIQLLKTGLFPKQDHLTPDLLSAIQNLDTSGFRIPTVQPLEVSISAILVLFHAFSYSLQWSMFP